MADKKTTKANAAAKPAKSVTSSDAKAKTTEAKAAKAMPTNVLLDNFKLIKHPHLAEKSMNMVETANMLVFMVDRRATKADIKKAIEKGFNVQVQRVNVEITRNGDKKAYIKLKDTSSAADVASRLGMI